MFFSIISIDTIPIIILQIPFLVENYAQNQNSTSLFSKCFFSPSCASLTPFFNLPTQSPFSQSIHEYSSPPKSFEQINIGLLERSTCNRKPFVLLDQYVANLEEDLTYHEVQHDLKWRLAMDDEMTSITKMKTWTLFLLPPGKKAITCRWIYKKKLVQWSYRTLQSQINCKRMQIEGWS